ASVAAEQSMMTASYDAGPQASNVTDAANQMPGLFGMRGPMPGMPPLPPQRSMPPIPASQQPPAKKAKK
ncbi:splicing factor 3a, subunit 1, partial [Perkinsus olseni]